MTLITPPAQRRRAHPVATHVYVVPIVRELPARPPDEGASGTW